jgi:hypothetical protein
VRSQIATIAPEIYTARGGTLLTEATIHLKAIAVVEHRKTLMNTFWKRNYTRCRTRGSIVVGFAVFGCGSLSIFAQSKPAEIQQVAPQQTTAPSEGINVLILGDSLALCGFGKRLDERFRKNPRVRSTFTYLACGTNPLSWLKELPYTNIKTHCGFVSIESNGSGRARELQDVYGIQSWRTCWLRSGPTF